MRDRLSLALWLLVGTAIPLLYFHVVWHRYILADGTVIPALLWLGTPGLVAAVVGWRHRSASLACGLAVWLGLVLAVMPALHIVFTMLIAGGLR